MRVRSRIMVSMNKLTTERRAQILGMMVEGNSIRAIVRMTGASKNTVIKLLEDAGEAFSEYQDQAFHDLQCKRIQLDEIWAPIRHDGTSFVSASSATHVQMSPAPPGNPRTGYERRASGVSGSG
jgi:hypothetical protein